MGKIKAAGWFVAFGLLLALSSLLISRLSSFTLPELAEEAGRQTEKKLQSCENALNKALSEVPDLNREELYNLFKNEGIGIYIVKGNEVIFWNNAQIPVPDSLRRRVRNDFIAELREGFYLFSKVKKDSLLGFSLCLIKPQHDIHNNYLKNDFSSWTGIPREVQLMMKTGSAADVKVRGTSLYSLRGEEPLYYSRTVNLICLVFFISGLFIFFLSLLFIFKKNPSALSAALVILPVVILRLLMFVVARPSFLGETLLYDYQVFANAHTLFNATLGDIIFNSSALLYISLVFYFYLHSFNSRLEKNLKVAALFLLAFIIVWQFNHLMKSLVSNSTMSFDFLNVFNIQFPVIISLLAIVFCCIALFITLYRAASLFNKTWQRSLPEFMLCSAALCVAIYFVSHGETVYQNCWPLLFAFLLFCMVRLQYQKFSLVLGILTAVMSATTAGFFNYFIDRNQETNLPVYADKLSEKKDTYLENEFQSIPKKIERDNNLRGLITFLPESKKEIQDLLLHKYFRGYFSTYNLDFSMFDPSCRPLLNPREPVLLNEGFFEDKIRYSDSTSNRDLFFVSGYKSNTQYIARIKLDDKNLYILMERKQFEDMGSFPELLLDQSQQKPSKLRHLSYAVYRSEQRTNKWGDFNYPFSFNDSLSKSQSSAGYIHHYFHTDDATHVIISENSKSWKYFFTYNSYLFLFFSLICFGCYFLYAILFTANFKTASLTRRIQTIVILLLLLAMSAVGITSGNLVTEQFEGDNVKQLQEKAQTIIAELVDQFNNKPEELFSEPQKENVNLKLQEFSHLYNSDISLFDKEGWLFNTSQPKLYELGLAAKVSNPRAYFNLKENKTSAVTVTERAGSLNYLSLYTPVFDGQKNFIGFVNLPYFARQSDLTNELSNIISALINVYIILFVISIVAGLVLAGYITKPLRLIKQQISNITLGKQNEALKWESNDEVGKLVTEYNNMLLKLEQSANLLAQSERESAWREMAKQVAHEIKNPLTPMKLNLQYLQHLMKNNPEDFAEKFGQASSSIIEQIDTLARIATEFSNFARLPGTQLEQINLLEIIRSSVNLFEKEKNSSIRVDLPFAEMHVMGDKEQALRIFNNILKNAIQATQEVKDPVIRISAEEKDEAYIIRISDNGTGIAESMKEKIFTPNFTTKSTGSGLGLAMVKSIVSNFGGKIWFESQEGIGSTFFIEFRKVN
jgi:signal transduction histidine kinase